jgi:hypothetical protein
MSSSRPTEFDEAVVRAMEKWPDVPECFGWLSLTRRGAWHIKGDLIEHARAVEFLGRHYRGDDQGRWFVQNGPQRVFIALDYTPWVFRFDAHSGFSSHTGIPCNDISDAFEDDEGNVLLTCGLGVGLVDDRDLAALSDHLEYDAEGRGGLHWNNGVLPLRSITRELVARTFGFVADPEPTP